MKSEAFFKIAFGVFAILFLGAICYAHIKAMRKHRSRFAQAANEAPILLWVRGIIAVPAYAGMIDWLFSADWFPWAVAPFSVGVRWGGIVFGILVMAWIWWTHITLESNYHGTMGLHEKHELITHGPYRFVRHPAYVAFPFFFVALFLISSNWLFGLPGIVLVTIVGLVRAPIEERQLLERFGDRYRTYMERTGRFLPKLSTWYNSLLIIL